MNARVPSALLTAAAALFAAAIALPAGTAAHAPDPVIGSKQWAQDVVIPWAYRAGQVPPAWMTGAIEDGAASSNATRASRAPTFLRQTSAASLVSYGEPTGCSPQGIACFSRSGAPTSFNIWFRANGYRFDWGRLSWCQGPDGFVNGCFDVHNVALDEFGHVLGLGHHQNLPDLSDFLDAVVQAVSRAKPAVGWDAHAYGRCDVARLQLEYDRPLPSSPFSTCLAIGTVQTLAASATSIRAGDSVRFTAALKTTASSANRQLSGDPVAERTVILQRRLPGAATWTTIATMTPTTPGTYEATVSPTATYDWRSSFTPANEGLVASVSPTVRVTVSSCTGTPCAQSASQSGTSDGSVR